MQDLKGAEYDKAYIATEVAHHEALLKTIDEKLVPAAQSAEIKELIVKVRPAIEAHLSHARDLQAKLGTSAAK